MTHQIRDTYYPIGEPQDLALQIGKLLVQLQAYDVAAPYFQQSLKLNGMQPETLYELSCCYYHLNAIDAALYCIHQILHLDAGFKKAKELQKYPQYLGFGLD